MKIARMLATVAALALLSGTLSSSAQDRSATLAPTDVSVTNVPLLLSVLGQIGDDPKASADLARDLFVANHDDVIGRIQLVTLAQTAATHGHLAFAQSLARPLADAHPDYLPAVALAGHVALICGNLDEAIARMAAMSDLISDTEVDLRLAFAYELKGDFLSSLRVLERAVKREEPFDLPVGLDLRRVLASLAASEAGARAALHKFVQKYEAANYPVEHYAALAIANLHPSLSPGEAADALASYFAQSGGLVYLPAIATHFERIYPGTAYGHLLRAHALHGFHIDSLADDALSKAGAILGCSPALPRSTASEMRAMMIQVLDRHCANKAGA
jgi:tetratricopeptide (TPR) repeat protein